MSFRTLREFLEHCESKGDLRRVKREVDWRYEVTEIACREAPMPCFMTRRVQISKRVWPSRSASSSRMVRRVGSASAR